MQSHIPRPCRRGPALASTSPDIGLGVSSLACPPPAPHVLGPQRSGFAFQRVPFLGVSGDTGHASSAKFERGGHRANAPLTVLWGERNGLRPP